MILPGFDPALVHEADEFVALLHAEGMMAPAPVEEINCDPRLRDYRGVSRFCPEHLKIVDMSGTLIPFQLNAMQRYILNEEIRARRRREKPWFIILKYRKGGVTTFEQAMNYWEIWRQQHRKCLMLAHRNMDTQIIFHMVETFHDHHPEQYRHPKSAAHRSWIELPGWDGIYMSGTAGPTGIGRGPTFQRVHLSEAAQYPDLNITHGSVAESLGDDAAYIIESTAYGRDGRGQAFYEFWQKAKRQESEFKALFFAWHHDRTKRIALREPDELHPLSGEEQELQQLHKLAPEQIKWWRAKRRELVAGSAQADLIHQEHPSDDDTAFLFGIEGYYDKDMLKECDALCIDPIRTEDNGRLRIFEEPKDGTTYCAGVDVAEGVGADDSTVVAFNARTGKQAFSWQWNRIPCDEFGSFILGDRKNGLGWRYKNTSTGVPMFLMIERNNHGHATLTALLKQAQYPHEAVYHHFDPTKDDPREKQSLLAGWPHGGLSHIHLQTEVGRLIREKSPRILDREVILSIRRVGAGSNGAEFGSRDFAVAAGLGGMAMTHVEEKPAYAWIGGRVVEL